MNNEENIFKIVTFTTITFIIALLLITVSFLAGYTYRKL